ncbi:MAG: MFS transporter [Anaerolineae bacterium]|nr:MFS transporter [Anaerolineae bacterium]
MLGQLISTTRRYPQQFWVLVGAGFIDRVGATMMFPFFALYITDRFQISMAQAGILLGMFSIASAVGNMIGGALTDRFGRRSIALFGLIMSAMSALAFGFADRIEYFYVLVLVVGVLADVGHPAQQAMVADLLPEEQHAEGFGIMRVVMNLAWVIGPSIGGLLVARSFLIVFIADALLSSITALIVYLYIRETHQAPSSEGTRVESILRTLAGYGTVTRDRLYMAFLLITLLMTLVYGQMYNMLSVYLRDVHGLAAQGYGLLMSLNAMTVVLTQFSVTRQTNRRPPLVMMALGALLYALGFGMYGVVTGFALFLLAMLIITLGEMVVVPVGQAIVTRFSPQDMRGRYLAMYGLTWTLSSAVGPGAAGYIMDTYNPALLWIIGAGICVIAGAGFYALHLTTRTGVDALTETGEARA